MLHLFANDALPDEVSLWLRGLATGALAVVITALLELSCIPDVQKLWSSQRDLYVSALWCNVWNNVIVGSLAYYLAVRYLCQPPGQLSWSEQGQAVIGITVIEAIFYYAVHKAFHEVKGLYWMHSYHHKFNTIVLPSSAHAVSIGEYTFAYMMPLVLGAAGCRGLGAGAGADEASFFIATSLIAVSNLLIHTPWLQQYDDLPWIFVSASDHGTHHRKLRGNYGAPIFHVDRILERVVWRPFGLSKQQQASKQM